MKKLLLLLTLVLTLLLVGCQSTQYEVTWVVDGQTFTETYNAGEIPVYKFGTNKPTDEYGSYNFDGWDKEITAVSGNVTYTANFSLSQAKYTYTWVIDGVSYEEEYAAGEIPLYKGETPSKSSSAMCSYEFVGWEKEVVEVTADVVNTAVFKKVYNSYEITFNVNGEKIVETYYYGATPSLDYIPVKEYDDNYIYEFAGWTDDATGTNYKVIPDVTKNASYTVWYSKIERWEGVKLNLYNVDGTYIKSEVVYAEKGKQYKVNAPTLDNLVPSLDYVMGICDDNEQVDIYYSSLSVWNGSSVSSSLSGTGTQADPYLVKSGADLAYVKSKASTFSGKYIKMMVSVDVSANGNFVIPSFQGHFDGNNCTVRGLNIVKTTENAGLFDMVTGGNSISNVIVYGSVSGTKKVAGVVAYAGANINNCVNFANITSSAGYAGGVTGWVTANSKGVINCHNYGTITSTASIAGGVIGYGATIISECSNFGNVTGTNLTAGIVGSASSASINDCMNFAEINGTNTTAGVVGKIWIDASVNATAKNLKNYGTIKGTSYLCGGVFGTLDNIEVSNSDNYGDVSSTTDALGGFVGAVYTGGKLINCNNYGSVTAKTTVAGICYTNQGKLIDCDNYGVVTATNSNGTKAAICVSNTGTVDSTCEDFSK